VRPLTSFSGLLHMMRSTNPCVVSVGRRRRGRYSAVNGLRPFPSLRSVTATLEYLRKVGDTDRTEGVSVMAEVMRFGQDRERRPNPLVELHPGFTASNGDAVQPYVRLVKFTKKDGKNTATSFNTSVSNIDNLIADLQAAKERAESGEPIPEVER